MYNQLFKPVFTSGYDPFDYTMLVYNRWGEVLFESHNAEFGWDGTYGTDGLVKITMKINLNLNLNLCKKPKTIH